MLKSDDLINKVKSYNKFLNPETLSKAYDFALKAHKTQKRDEGVPYIIHPIAVASILTELKLDSATIATGLLHDTIEDVDGTTEAKLATLFGSTIAALVQGVTNISQYPLQPHRRTEQRQAENYLKLLLATAKDVRVILIKLADRLYNMETLNFVRPEKQRRIAKETMDIYVPIASRMGIYKIKAELED